MPMLGQKTQVPILDDFFEVKFLDFPAGIHRPESHHSPNLVSLVRYTIANRVTQPQAGKPFGLHTQ